ncbi:unnamed protein product [Clonostachys rosea]|uniref:Uncharacterized protein n=1 Tax=Bionectria ochroleuca TaxID=29856 RepID=A0ABY6UNJ4_BIOOC|nr:unnamed protein product [Clonostachys rosea]
MQLFLVGSIFRQLTEFQQTEGKVVRLVPHEPQGLRDVFSKSIDLVAKFINLAAKGINFAITVIDPTAKRVDLAETVIN